MKKSKTRYLVVGGVAAGATAAARLRRLDEEAEITLFERGRYVSFANCGLPYYIGGDIRRRSKLVLQSPEGFWSRYRVKVELETEALSVDRKSKTVLAVGPEGEKSYGYDALILAQGGNPVLPTFEGADQKRVFVLWNLEHMDMIHRFIDSEHPKNALIVGGGFIGTEMAEALAHRGLSVTLLEKTDQILGFLDKEFAEAARSELEKNGVRVFTGAGLLGLTEKTARFDDGREIEADLVLLSLGVRPELTLARNAGLEIGPGGGLAVNEYLQTSDPSIFAAGDMCEIAHKVSGKKVRIPLAGPANRQGRVAASNAAGEKTRYRGALGSSVVKIFSHTAAATGLSEKSARGLGFDAMGVTVHRDDHASYYPGSTTLSLKLVFENKTGLLLGGQAWGEAGADKRVDVLASALQGRLTLEDLAELDLAYSPPYSSANDPINVAAFAGLNRMSGYSPSIGAEDFARNFDPEKDLLLDVRTLGEWYKGRLKGAVHLPLDELRDRLTEIPAGRRVFVYCEAGYRGHLAARILVQRGFEKVINVSGGFISLRRAAYPLENEQTNEGD